MRSLLFRLVIISVSTVLVIGSSTNGNEETNPSMEEEMEGEDVTINKLQEDYRNAFSHVHGFLDSLSAVMERLNQRMESFETRFRQSSENMKALEASLLTTIQSELRQSSENRKTTDASLLTTIQRVEKVVTGGCIAKGLNNLTLFEYHRHASLNPTPSTGKSFNGSTLNEISDRIPTSRTSYTLTVEFANRLDSTIDSFQINQPGISAFNLPPQQIPGNTKEAFTFKGSGNEPSVAFSYLIPDPTLRVAVYAKSTGWSSDGGVGLAFLPSSVPITTYYSNPGSFGEYASTSRPAGSEKTILAKKNGFIAKAIFEETGSPTVRVELMEVPLC